MNRSPPRLLLAAAAAVLVALAGPAAAQDAEVDFSGYFQTDLRYRLFGNEWDIWYQPLDPQPGVVRNQSILKGRLNTSAGKFRGVADIDLVVIGYPDQLTSIDDLSRRRVIDPIRLEAHALYLEARDLVPGLDLRLGQQLAQFGVGDQFNPTNNLNAIDVEDPLLFGEQLANVMARADVSVGNWSLTGVLVPVFKPANVPTSARSGPLAVHRLPFVDDALRWRVHAEQAAGEVFGYPTIVSAVTPQLPAPSLRNMQGFVRLGGWLGGQDIALSWYRGFTDVPTARANHTRQVVGDACNPKDGEDCVDGVLHTDTTLGYTPIQVFGLNVAGEMNPLGWISEVFHPIGYRLELAIVQPDRADIVLTQDEIAFSIVTQPAGEYEYELADGRRPAVVDARPYPKWVLGLDYTFGRHVYVNAQWVHGFPDEVGAGDALFQSGWAVRDGGVDSDTAGTVACALARDGSECAWETLKPRINDYLVLGVDINFLSNAGLLRLFTIWDLVGVYDERWDPVALERVRTHHGMFTSEGFSAILYPMLSYNLGHGFQLEGGALMQLGKEYTKFGDPATGGSFLWTRGRFSF